MNASTIRLPSLRVSSRGTRRITFILNALLLVLLAHRLAGLTWALLPEPAQPAAAPPSSSAAAEGKPNDQGNPAYQRIAEWHLFGKPPPAAGQPKAPVDAPETRLNLTLRGILYNDDPAQARVIIAPGNGPEEAYKIGDDLSGGARINAIYPDKVMLLRDGQYETLTLPEDQVKGAATQSGPQSRRRPDEANSSLPTGNTGQVLSKVRQQIVDHPQQIQQYVRFRPYTRNGHYAGVRVTPGANPRLFNLTGLQPGDVITSVNNITLDNPDRGFQALEFLAQAQEVNLTVLRNGQPRNLTISFEH